MDAQHWLMPLAVSLVVFCVGVALSVLGGNAGSLVGVAISASLLPPAVNAGLFWALALVLASGGKRERERERSLCGLGRIGYCFWRILRTVLSGLA